MEAERSAADEYERVQREKVAEEERMEKQRI
jgi:hypothetical protein